MQIIPIDFPAADDDVDVDDDDESVMGNKASIYRIKETYTILNM